MDSFLALLSQLGLGIATNAVYDYLKQKFGTSIDRQTLESEIQNIINLNGINMTAATVIDAIASNGFITIQGSHLHGSEGIVFGSIHGAAVVGNNTRLSTDRTSIDAGGGAFMKTQGNAQVRQNPDGSISFHVGENDSRI